MERKYIMACADPECFVREGPTVKRFFLVDEVRKDPNTTINGVSLAGR